jgi:hypothetical protein
VKSTVQAAFGLLLDLVFYIWETFFQKKNEPKKYGGPYGLA